MDFRPPFAGGGAGGAGGGRAWGRWAPGGGGGGGLCVPPFYRSVAFSRGPYLIFNAPIVRLAACFFV